MPPQSVLVAPTFMEKLPTSAPRLGLRGALGQASRSSNNSRGIPPDYLRPSRQMWLSWVARAMGPSMPEQEGTLHTRHPGDVLRRVCQRSSNGDYGDCMRNIVRYVGMRLEVVRRPRRLFGGYTGRRLSLHHRRGGIVLRARLVGL